MNGGTGDDLYFVDSTSDIIIEAQNGGIDETRSSAFSYTLPDWVNNLTLAAGNTAFNGTGNAIENLLVGNQQGNQFFGLDGNDTFVGGGGRDSYFGGAGADSFVFNVAPEASNDGFIADLETGIDKIHLDARVMTALGAGGNFATNDARFYAAAGAMNGHDADDRIIFDTSNGQLWYDADGNGAGGALPIATVRTGNTPDGGGSVAPLAATDLFVDNGGTPTPSPTPTPTPTPGNSLNGTSGNDTLVGTTGNDTIFGNSGNDWIEGRGGNDVLSGGSGMDSYVFREFGAANADTLNNFDGNNWDSLRFDNAAFTGLGADGRFTAGDARFFAGAGATGGHDADDRIVYNTSTGQLYYDADGSGAGGAELVATIQGAAPVVAPDIWVI